MTNPNPSVTARVERRVIPTYPTLAADPNPMFYETRNIQGSKGNIYPHPLTDQLSSEKVDREYAVVILENEYIQMQMLPEIGGRIFAGLDKTNGYNFFYPHKVIKPALIGLFGPWISGGVEFNWPQHHRPGTYDPACYSIEENPADGSVTVWMGEHDALNRTKGMVGVCLYPGKAYVETKVRLYNRTALPQTFLWWANAGVYIHEKYQVIFPPDVHHAVNHVKAPVISYPIGKGDYNGIDYGEGTDLSWWVNSPYPISFFAGASNYEFFGGYDHLKDAGLVHFADAGISPGKKYFAWANGPFGHQWQKNLMDDTGEYLELMAGVYTDNQPDFTWIMPYETKTFSQFWYPVQQTGGMKNANLRAALNLEFDQHKIRLAAYGIEETPGAHVILEVGGQPILDQTVDLGPGKPFKFELEAPGNLPETAYLLRVCGADGAELIRYRPEAPWDGTLPEPYKPSRKPDEIPSVEELYIEGLHLEQYRHPTISPEIYWNEALRRDPGDARSHLALGKLALSRAETERAESQIRAAVQRLTSRNLNPYDGEAHYDLGLALQTQGRLDEAYKAFYKSSWTYAWKSPAYYALAQIDCCRGDWAKALDHLDRSLDVNASHLKARNLKAAVLRRTGRCADAVALAIGTSALDRLDAWSRNELLLSAQTCAGEMIAQKRQEELSALLGSDVQAILDLAFEYAAAGMWREAFDLLEPVAVRPAAHPMAAYTLAWLAAQMGNSAEAANWFKRGQAAPPDYCFPWRLEELTVLRAALDHNPSDARAAYYLANLLYDKRQYGAAIDLWKQAAALEPGLSIAWRNLGLAAYNLEQDIPAALAFYARSLAANPHDPRTLLEQDNLLKRQPAAPEKRLQILESSLEVVDRRDDLTVHRMALLNCTGRAAETLAIAARRQFHAWEGGEGSVTGQYAYAHWILGREALERGDALAAREHFLQGSVFPDNLGEQPRDQLTTPLVYYRGLAEEQLGNPSAAAEAFEKVLRIGGGLDVTGVYRALALMRLDREAEGRAALDDIIRRAQNLVENPPEPNFFRSGHPNPIFEEDPRPAQRQQFLLLVGFAQLALGEKQIAKDTLQRVLSHDPANLIAREELSRL